MSANSTYQTNCARCEVRFLTQSDVPGARPAPRGTKVHPRAFSGERAILHLYYTALFAVIVANVITVLFVIAIAINGRKRDN
jgi:hypothetical protein